MVSNPDAADAPIKIGWFGPLSGANAPWGQPELKTIKMMAEDFNAKGGIDVGRVKRKIEIIAYDDKGRTGDAIMIVKKLTSQDHVVAIVGPQGSGEAMPIGDACEEAKVPCVVTTATNSLVTVTATGTVKPYMFRVCFIDDYQGKVAAEYAYNKLEKRRAAILMIKDDPFSPVMARSFKERFGKIGGNIVFETGFLFDDKDFKNIIDGIKKSDPDIVFMPIYYMHIVPLARQARKLGLNAVFLGGDGWHNKNLGKEADNVLEGYYYIDHVDPDTREAEKFNDEYIAKYQVMADLNSYMAHDAFLVVADAIQRSGSSRGEDIKNAIEFTNLKGISGQIKMDPNHDPLNKAAWLFKIIENGIKLQEKYTINN